MELRLNELRDGAEVAATVAAAVHVGLLEALAPGYATVEQLAERLRLDPRAVRIVLLALGDLDLVRSEGGQFTLTEEARRQFGDAQSPDYAGGGLPLWLQNLRAWSRLPTALRTGEPVESDDESDGDEALQHFLAGMAAAPRERVQLTVERCLARRPGARALPDLGGGPGHLARAFVDAGLEVTLFDRPETVAVAARAYGLRAVRGLHLVSGDFLVDPLPTGPFDIVLASNITHIYPPATNRELLRRIGDTLAPGGLLAVGDFVRGRSPRAARFAIVMLLRTEGGDTYTEDEYRSWLAGAGFRDVEVDDVDVDRQLITALKS